MIKHDVFRIVLFGCGKRKVSIISMMPILIIYSVWDFVPLAIEDMILRHGTVIFGLFILMYCGKVCTTFESRQN